MGLPKLSKARVVKVQSRNGEIHLILQDSSIVDTGESAENFDEVELKRIMRNEVSKPLLLLRSE